VTQPPLDEILAQCLDEIRSGRSTVEACLARYPAQRAELEPLLRTALWVAQAEAVRPDPAFRAAAKTRLLNRIRAEEESRRAAVPPVMPQAVTFDLLHRLRGWIRKLQPQQPRRRYAMFWALIFAAIALVAGGGGIAYASTDALPDDALYPVKLALEDAQLLFADPEEDVQLHLEFAQRRLEEARIMAQQGQTEGLERALENYEAHLQAALQLAQQVGAQDPQVWARMAQQVERHQQRLQTMAQVMEQQGLTEAEQRMIQTQERVRQTLEHVHRFMGQHPKDMPSTPPAGPHGPKSDESPMPHPKGPMPTAMPGGKGHGEGRGQGSMPEDGGQNADQDFMSGDATYPQSTAAADTHPAESPKSTPLGTPVPVQGTPENHPEATATCTPAPTQSGDHDASATHTPMPTPTSTTMPAPTMTATPSGDHDQGDMGGGHDR